MKLFYVKQMAPRKFMMTDPETGDELVFPKKARGRIWIEKENGSWSGTGELFKLILPYLMRQDWSILAIEIF